MKLIPAKEDGGLRLDIWLEKRLPGYSRSRIQAFIKAGNVLVDGSEAKPHLKIRPGVDIQVNPPPPVDSRLEPEDIPLDILHEDADIIVVNKPAGLVVHPAAGNPRGTLVNALLNHCLDLSGIGGEKRPGIVHRLDKDTSGVMVVAKNQSSLESLVEQFKRGEVHKEYLALVRGVPDPSEGRIETLIGRSLHDRKKMAARPVGGDAGGGRYSLTEYHVIEEMSACSLIRVRIHTGRTHQIRVHMAHIHHPVLGDRRYGGRKSADPVEGILRQMLHAERLDIIHPGAHEKASFRAPVPPDMQQVLEKARTGQ